MHPLSYTPINLSPITPVHLLVHPSAYGSMRRMFGTRFYIPVLITLFGFVFLLGTLGARSVYAHPKPLDDLGGHFDERSGLNHYHKPRFDQSRLEQSLSWGSFQKQAVIRGVLARIDQPDAVWIKINYRPAFLDLAQHIPPSHIDQENSLVKVWLQHVSPELSVNEDKRFNAWFKERVVYEIRTRLEGKTVTAHLDLEAASKRPRGVVFFGEESLNLWLVTNGWSYYLLSDPPSPYHEQFVLAEDSARRRKVGLWKNH